MGDGDHGDALVVMGFYVFFAVVHGTSFHPDYTLAVLEAAGAVVIAIGVHGMHTLQRIEKQAPTI